MTAAHPSAGDLVDRITQDHARLGDLLDRIQGSRQDEFRDDVVRDALSAAARHAETDRDELHPLLGGLDGGGAVVDAQVRDQAEIEQHARTLREVPREHAEYEVALNRFVDGLRAHLTDERELLGRVGPA